MQIPPILNGQAICRGKQHRISRANHPARRKEAIMEERLYDLIFISRPATPEDEIKKVIAGIEHTCAEKGGKIEKTELWGTRKLAYRVAKHREGMYVYQQIDRKSTRLNSSHLGISY